jgi:hypothetical protein
MGTYLLGMILHLRFDGHWVFAGVYEPAAHYYALHLVRHIEATVAWVVEWYGVVSLNPDEAGWSSNSRSAPSTLGCVHT